MAEFSPLDFSELHTYSLHERVSKVNVDDFASPFPPGAGIRDFLRSLPCQLTGREFPELIEKLAECYRGGKLIMVGMGAHVIKVGLNPVLIDLMERGLISSLAFNGAGIVHDTEVAVAGKTSEEVGDVLGKGQFGAARETGEVVNEAINRGAQRDIGLGKAMGEYLIDRNYPYNHLSLLASAARLDIPLTVHVAVGTDIVHMHPSADGASIGKTSYHDFQLFCGILKGLSGGAFLNIGSAVLLPEIFLKALTVTRNLGYEVNNFTTANFDFIRHYRTMTNVVNRPTAEGGKGYNFIGHHELMIPLLAAGLIEVLGPDS
ncbi:MAG: hypothetical protein ACQES8_04690 [Thermodesulfobacteriota bacterium]